MASFLLCSCLGSKKESRAEAVAIPIRGELDGHAYVDLGLSVLWATENICTSPSDLIGDFVSFGELKPKERYLPENYTFKDTMLSEISGTKYDYASHIWGGRWRTPTFPEYEELFRRCEKRWNEQKRALIVKGPSGDSITFYAQGYKYDNERKHPDDGGYFWSSTQNIYYPEYAWRLGFIPTWNGVDDVGLYYGYQVRAVIDK